MRLICMHLLAFSGAPRLVESFAHLGAAHPDYAGFRTDAQRCRTKVRVDGALEDDTSARICAAGIAAAEQHRAAGIQHPRLCRMSARRAAAGRSMRTAVLFRNSTEGGSRRGGDFHSACSNEFPTGQLPSSRDRA